MPSQDHVEGVQLYTDLSCFTESMSSQDHVEGVQLYTDLSCFTEPMSSQDHVEGVFSDHRILHVDKTVSSLLQ